MKTSFKASLIALAIASFPMGGQAASLGQINVFSGLGQPLRAEIAVSATPQELQSLSARIGSIEAFRSANLPYSSAASAVRVSLDTRSARPVIRLSSVRPINDPFMELLVELNWASGQLSREYTFLLDPVDLAAPKPVAARAEAPSAAASVAPAMPAARGAARAVAAPPAPDRYIVRRGDTLRSIAASTAPAGTSLDQMLVALFRANPGAFDGANINRLRAGAVLSVPSAERVQGIDAVEARREVVAQAADFEAYRRRLATSVASKTVAPDTEAEQASGGRVVPKVEEARQVADGGDKVRVSRSEKAGEGDAGARLQALEEELATREKALQDANQRLSQLEQSIRDMQKLLEVRSASLAQAQQQAGVAPAPAAQAAAQVTPPAGSEAAPNAGASPEKAQEPAAQPVAPTAPVVPEPAKPAAAEDAPKAEVAPQPKPAPKKVIPAPPPEEPSFLESVMSDPTMLAAGGGVAALLLALAGLKLRQRRAASGAARAGEEGGGETAAAGGRAVFGGTGGQSVDTGASMLMTDFSQSGLSAIDTDEGVDPVAEADVYMAYGRDAQAEEILQDAMKADPDRAAIHLKLLEIYAQRKSVKQFETVATDLYARTGGRGADWERAAALGRKLDPENPLYGVRSSVRDADVVAPATEVPLAVSAGLGAAAAGVAVDAAGGNVLADERPAPTSGEAQPESLAALDFTAPMPSVEPSHSQLKDTWTLPGELAQFSDGTADEAGPSLEPTPAAEQPELPASLEVIDFDLGLDEPFAADEQSPAADGIDMDVQPVVVQPESEGLTFDLDVGELNVGSASALASSAPELQQPEAGMSETVLEDIRASATGGLDFNLAGFDADFATATAPDLNATMMDVHAAGFEPETTALGLDFDASEDASDIVSSEVLDLQATVIAPEAPAFSSDATALDLEFDLPDLDLGTGTVASIAGEAAASENPLSVAPGAGVAAGEAKATFDDGLLDFDFDLEPQAAAPGVAPSLDLTSIDLSLDGLDETHGEEAAAGVPATGAEPSAAFAGDHDEIETKIELARAYEEMGDKEGALELLDEVLREGGAQQQSIAREIIARLG